MRSYEGAKKYPVLAIYIYLEALQVGGVGPVLVVPDTSDAGEPDGDAVSRVQVGAGELGSCDLPHRGHLAGGGEGGEEGRGGRGGGRGGRGGGEGGEGGEGRGGREGRGGGREGRGEGGEGGGDNVTPLRNELLLQRNTREARKSLFEEKIRLNLEMHTCTCLIQTQTQS